MPDGNGSQPKMLTCPVCGAEELSPASLETHLRVEHGVTND